MAGLTFEGNTAFVNDKQLTFITNAIAKRGFKNAKVVFQPVGDSTSASVVRVIIQGSDEKSLRMIIKVAPTLDVVRKMSNTTEVFRNEHIMYTQVLPKFDQLQKAADIPDEDRLKFPSCYGSFQEAPNEMILLEDLKVSGFEMLNNVKPLSNHCVRSILKNFAQLHSLSHVLKHKEPEVFDDYKNGLFDVMETMNEGPEMKMLTKQLEKSALSVLRSDIHKKIVIDGISGASAASSKMMRDDRESKHAVIHHGDAWTNNFMFRFENGLLKESILFDYQGAKSGNSVIDLHHMIFNCTDYESRKKHYNEWIDHYHSELEKILSSYGIKANYVYPREKLDADLKRYAKISLKLAIIWANMLLIRPEDAGNMKEAMDSADIEAMMENFNMGSLSEEASAEFRLRIEGVINSFIELGYVNV